ncbi:ArsR/SmtB family transcription factor [Sporolactobacillus vineae]|uniref:ArsR/SmtB family transcription factor n=1 Tax=Sporolactobacillus vineae TaxID=444463 RepID=UPI00028915C2|nr:winged helix-turn-helix domain-containing protein [Sporolactobacillus vineae]
MKRTLIIKNLNQLKVLSDPFRSQLMMLLIEKPYTGQQLAEHFNLSRARVHYHLHELEKNHLIELVRTEEINGIVQKFYQSVAQGFLPDVSLLPQKHEVSETYRQIVLSMINRTRMRAATAPDESFSIDENVPDNMRALATYWEITMTDSHFKKFAEKMVEVFEEFDQCCKKDGQESGAKPYFMSAFGFQVDQKEFDQKLEKED